MDSHPNGMNAMSVRQVAIVLLHAIMIAASAVFLIYCRRVWEASNFGVVNGHTNAFNEGWSEDEIVVKPLSAYVAIQVVASVLLVLLKANKGKYFLAIIAIAVTGFFYGIKNLFDSW